MEAEYLANSRYKTLHNIPEGLAVSVPLRREGMSRLKSFWYGQLSGVVEPAAAVIGAATVIVAKSLLPYALGFAAGAMIFVVVEEVIPESQRGGNTDLATTGAMIGFALMMVLDVAFRDCRKTPSFSRIFLNIFGFFLEKPQFSTKICLISS